MRTGTGVVVVAASLMAVLSFDVQRLPAANETDLIRDVLRQQSDAGHAGCTGVQRALTAGTDARLVVRTAVELGYNPCQMIRCALEAKVDAQTTTLCEKVIRGAADAGVQADVISRCSTEVCDPAAVAALLGDTSLDPYYCYFADRPRAAPELRPPPPVIDRDIQPPQASPFTF